MYICKDFQKYYHLVNLRCYDGNFDNVLMLCNSSISLSFAPKRKEKSSDLYLSSIPYTSGMDLVTRSTSQSNVDWIIGWSDDRMIGWSDDRMIGWSDDRMIGRSDGWIIGWSDDRMIRWSDDRKIGWLDDRMIRWLEDSMADVYKYAKCQLSNYPIQQSWLVSEVFIINIS